jgi:elongation factor P hydroxylase
MVTRIGELPLQEQQSYVEFNSPLQAEQRLAELLTIRPEVANELRPQLRAVVEAAAPTCISEHDQRALQFTGSILDWQLFGQTGDPLPAGLVYVPDASGRVEPRYDATQGFGRVCQSEALETLGKFGLDEVSSVAIRAIESHKDEIRATVRAVIEMSPAYHLTQAFDAHTESRYTEQSLTPYHREVLEVSIEDNVKEKFGVETVIPHSFVAKAINRKLRMHDDDTMLLPGPAESDNNAIERAQDFFAPEVIAWAVAYGVNREELDGFGTRRLGGAADESIVLLLKEGVKSNNRDYISNATDYILNAALEMNKGLGAHDSRVQQWVGTEFLYQYMQILLVAQKEVTYGEIVEQALQKAVSETVTTCLQGFCEYDPEADDLLGALRRPLGEVLPKASYEKAEELHDASHDNHDKELGFTTATELERQKKQIIGNVVSRPHDEEKIRIIQSDLYNPVLPEHDYEGTLQLRFRDQEWQGADPMILGYELVSRNDNLFGFKQLEYDPYAPANVLLTPEQQDEISEMYRELSLDKLAEAIEDNDDLTVSQLVKIMRETGHYPLPESLDEDDFPSSFEVDELSDFEPFVRNGILNVQCNGAAKFLQLSLESIFGEGCASTIGGKALRRSNVINASSHAQTVFSHDGFVYILDATPFSDSDSDEGDRVRYTRSRQPMPATVLTRPPVTSTFSSGETFNTDDTTGTYQERAEALQNSFEMQIAAAFDMYYVEDLYEKIVTLPAADPVRQTLELVLSASRGIIDPSELEQARVYIEKYQEATPELLAQIGLPVYEMSVISLLMQTINRIPQAKLSLSIAKRAGSIAVNGRRSCL